MAGQRERGWTSRFSSARREVEESRDGGHRTDSSCREVFPNVGRKGKWSREGQPKRISGSKTKTSKVTRQLR